MRFMIAGYGSIGRRHLQNLLALGESDVFLYRTGHGTLPEEETTGLAVETDLAAALARRPDAVIIANPTARHLEVAIPAARAGCHLLIEKPISHDLVDIPVLRQALADGGGRALVGFQFRYHPGLIQACQLIQSGEIGEPISARCEWGEYLPGWHPWEDFRQSYSARPDLGGGVVLTLSHPLDYLMWFFGDISRVWADTGSISPLRLEVEDYAEIQLDFTAGVRANVHLDYYRRPPVHRLEVVCSRGLVSWDNGNGVTRAYQVERETWQEFPPPAGFERNWLFIEELRHFIAVCRGEVDPICDLEDGEKALRLALAVLASSRQGIPLRMDDV